MTHDQRTAVIDMLATAAVLRLQAQRLEGNAQIICDHRREDGNFAVYTGFPVTPQEVTCNYCGLDSCYIDDYS